MRRGVNLMFVSYESSRKIETINCFLKLKKGFFFFGFVFYFEFFQFNFFEFFIN